MPCLADWSLNRTVSLIIAVLHDVATGFIGHEMPLETQVAASPGKVHERTKFSLSCHRVHCKTHAGGGPSSLARLASALLLANMVNLISRPRDQWPSDRDDMEQASDDRALIRAIAGGDAKALERLFSRNQTRVFRYLVRVVRNEAVAEELMNEVFLAAWQGAGRYEGRSEPTTWLLSIAHNKAVSALRKKREVSGGFDEASAELEDTDDSPEVTAQKSDKSAQIRAAMTGLSAEHREILDLVYYQEQSISEAAEVLGIPEATVKTRMFYARKKLSELLKERGVDRGWP